MRGQRQQKQEDMFRSSDKLDTLRGQLNEKGTTVEASHCLGLWEEPRVIGESLLLWKVSGRPGIITVSVCGFRASVAVEA
eukprot:g37370.t1